MMRGGEDTGQGVGLGTGRTNEGNDRDRETVGEIGTETTIELGTGPEVAIGNHEESDTIGIASGSQTKSARDLVRGIDIDIADGEAARRTKSRLIEIPR
jgi:hypothetical protein